MSARTQFLLDRTLGLILLVGLGASLPAAAQSPEAEALRADLRITEKLTGPVRIEAGRLTAREGGKHLLLSEGVHLIAEGLSVRAEWMEVWPDEERANLAGSVRLVDGPRVMLAERLELDQRQARAVIRRGILLVKRGVTQPELAACPTASGLSRAGTDALRLEGLRWVREGDAYRLTRARFTPCDCGPDEAPSWELRAAEADVVPDERAWLRLPVLVLKDVPVLALPVAYLPLSERRTGLLMPQVNYSGRDGWVLSESLFVTLGEHADTTASLDWIQDRGLRQRLELRAAPARAAWLAATFSHIQDIKYARQGVPKAEREDFDGPAAHRYTVELDGWADLPGQVDLRAQVRLYSDSNLIRDFMSDMAGRAVDSAPSRVAVAWRGRDQVVWADAAWFQDLRLSRVDLFDTSAGDRDKWGMDPVGDTIQRLGAVTYRLLPVRLIDALTLGMEVEVANLASSQKAWRDFGSDGTPNQREPSYDVPEDEEVPVDRAGDDVDGGEGDGIYGHGELRRALRLRFEPELVWPQAFGRYALLEARLAHRQLVYLPHGPDAPDPSTRGISFARLDLSTELSRLYGQGADRIGHTIAPRVRLAGAFRGLESDDPRPYLDLMDRLLTDAFQLSVGLDSGLYLPAAGWGLERALSVWLEQGFDLREKRLAQLTGGFGLDVFPVDARLAAGWSWDPSALAEVDAGLGLRDRRGDSLRATYLYLRSVREGGPPLPLAERTQRELGLLFGALPLPLRGMGDSLHVAAGSARLNLQWGLSATGNVYADLRQRKIETYGAGLAYQSDCHCWGVSASFRMLRGQRLPDFFFLLDLGPLGRAGGTTARTTRF